MHASELVRFWPHYIAALAAQHRVAEPMAQQQGQFDVESVIGDCATAAFALMDLARDSGQPHTWQDMLAPPKRP